MVPLYGEHEAKAVVGRLLEDKYGIGKLERITVGSRPFPHETEWNADLERLEAWEPVQYVTGYEQFCGRTFRLSRDTLIPRGETEQLVRTILDGSPRKRILDIGTGSGAIAVTLPRNGKRPGWKRGIFPPAHWRRRQPMPDGTVSGSGSVSRNGTY